MAICVLQTSIGCRSTRSSIGERHVQHKRGSLYLMSSLPCAPHRPRVSTSPMVIPCPVHYQQPHRVRSRSLTQWRAVQCIRSSILQRARCKAAGSTRLAACKSELSLQTSTGSPAGGAANHQLLISWQWRRGRNVTDFVTNSLIISVNFATPASGWLVLGCSRWRDRVFLAQLCQGYYH